MSRITVVALSILFAMAVMPVSAATADETVHPGDFIRFDSGTNNIWCTAAFVFDGVGAQAGKVFMGTAAHCIQKPGGQEITIGSGPENGATDVAGTTGGTEVLGHIVAQGKDGGEASDWALIEVRPEMEARVRPELRRYPQHPTGVATPSDVAAHDPLEHVGYGVPFFVHPALRNERQGLFLRSDGRTFESLLAVYGGDSGGPIVHGPSGKALGILNGYLCHTVPPDCVVHGVTVAETIAQAAQQGFTVRLRTAGQPAPAPAPPRAEPGSAPAAPSGTAEPAATGHPPAPQAAAAPPAARKAPPTCAALAKKLEGRKRSRALRRCAVEACRAKAKKLRGAKRSRAVKRCTARARSAPR